MLTKFTIHVQRQRSFVFKNSQLLFHTSVLSPNNSFSFRDTGICRTIIGSYAECQLIFGSRLLSMVLLSKSFHNMVIFLLQ